MKYYLKSELEMIQNSPDTSSTPRVYEITQVEENTVVKSSRGEILITPPNYLVTDSEGNQTGLAEPDIDYLYQKAEQGE